MNKVMKFNIIKTAILSVLFYGAIYFENAQGNRFITLITAFGLYIIIGFIRHFLFRKNTLYTYSFLLDIAFVFFIEYNSRFLINYFFHSFYLVILLELTLSLKRNRSIILGVIAILISQIKYILLISHDYNISNISQMLFIVMISIFILVLTSFVQYYKEERENKDQLYTQLLNAHKQLKEYAFKIEELTIVEERNRIARDIHDTLGHNMTAIIMEMEMASHVIKENPDYAKELLEKSKKSAREGLIRIREVVETLKPDNDISDGIESLKELINEFCESTGINIDLVIEGEVMKTSPAINTTLYRIIQESLTNAVRHGKSTEVKIRLKYLKENIRFIIKDNGEGSKDISKGFGLKSMTERAIKAGGKVEFYSIDGEGFLVDGLLPLEVLENDQSYNS